MGRGEGPEKIDDLKERVGPTPLQFGDERAVGGWVCGGWSSGVCPEVCGVEK